VKRIEDIKNFEDIDTYYEISNIVEEVFQDRVEAHKHLVTANKEIERLNNIIKEYEKFMIDVKQFAYLDELKELKGDNSNE